MRKGAGKDAHRPRVSFRAHNEEYILEMLSTGVVEFNRVYYPVLSYRRVARDKDAEKVFGRNAPEDRCIYDLELETKGSLVKRVKKSSLDAWLEDQRSDNSVECTSSSIFG
ncbi:MAG: hypothetical protein JSS66_05555 [Armatimonadetes bacterium]|nr:hypothetical protein [Armatimonadota bacterium]